MKILMFLLVLGTMLFGEEVKWMTEDFKQRNILKVCLDGYVYFYVDHRSTPLIPKLEYRNTMVNSNPTKIYHATCKEGK